MEYAAPPAGCPSPEQARNLVVARLGFDPFIDAEASAFTLRVDVESAPDGLRARVERLDNGQPVGHRELADPQGNCTELVAAAAFAASLLVDPTGAMRKAQAPRTEKAPDPGPTRADDPFDAIPAAAPLRVPAHEPLRPLLGARAVGSIGLAPSASFGVALEAGFGIGKWRFAVEGHADFPAEAALLSDGTGAKTSSMLGAIVPCFMVGIVRACAIGAAGTMLAETVNVEPAYRDRGFFGLVGLRGGVELPLSGPLHLVAHVDGLVPLRRITVRTQGMDVWTSPPFALSTGLGVAVWLQ